jgi:mannose-6-phosphate isomerase-like protein (cupin superfamily)
VHLATAGLLLGEVDLVAEPLEQPRDRDAGGREQRVVEAGDEERCTQGAATFRQVGEPEIIRSLLEDGRTWAVVRLAAVPFTLRNLKEDLEDVGSNFDGAPGLEFRLASKALELEQSGLGYQRIPPDSRFPYGHTHKQQEEVYVVVGGSGRMKLDDEIVEVKKWDVVRVPPGTWRGYESGPEGLEILVFGAPNLGENPREDVEGQRDWWAD